MPDLTPEQLKQALQSAVAEIEANMGNILFNAANVGAAQMQFRVFNKGITTGGTNMKYKSAPYKRLRTDAGLQTNHKDLMFTGNLFNSLTILSKSNEEVSYGFNNAETATIRTYQETSDKQVNEPIFDLNEKEEMAMYKAIGKGLGDLIIKTITSYPNKPAKVAMEGKDPVSKSIARQQKKKAQRKAIEKKKKLKERVAKAESSPNKLTRVELQKKALIKADLKASSIIKNKEALQKQLRQKQKEINAKQREAKAKALQRFNKRKQYLEKFINKKQEMADKYAMKLDKVKSGSKSAKEYSRKYLNTKKQIDKARAELYTTKFTSPTSKSNPIQKRLDAQNLKLAKARASIRSQANQLKQSKGKMREQQRIARAKQLRMGTYKPKKRKKK